MMKKRSPSKISLCAVSPGRPSTPSGGESALLSEQMRHELIPMAEPEAKTEVIKSGCTRGNVRLAGLETDFRSEARATHGRDAPCPLTSILSNRPNFHHNQ